MNLKFLRIVHARFLMHAVQGIVYKSFSTTKINFYTTLFNHDNYLGMDFRQLTNKEVKGDKYNVVRLIYFWKKNLPSRGYKAYAT